MRRGIPTTAGFILAIGAVFTLGGCPTSTATLGDTDTNDDVTDGTADPIGGGTFTIEPDDFDDGTELTNIDERVTLSTALDDNSIAELFTVTATDDADNAATGERVFGHSEIPFWNNDRRLRIDFKNRGTAVSVVFINGEAFDPSTARLEAFDADDKLIAEYVTDAIQPGQSEEMSVTGSNIAYAIAYLADGDGSFGRFDTLMFTASGGAAAQTAAVSGGEAAAVVCDRV